MPIRVLVRNLREAYDGFSSIVAGVGGVLYDK
jgi:hypothetical protein